MDLGPPTRPGAGRPGKPGRTTSKADLVIKALGFDPEDLPRAVRRAGAELNRWGAVIDYKTMLTSLAGVFAAGDIVRGASLVVWAIKDGRDAAEGIAYERVRRQPRASLRSSRWTSTSSPCDLSPARATTPSSSRRWTADLGALKRRPVEDRRLLRPKLGLGKLGFGGSSPDRDAELGELDAALDRGLTRSEQIDVAHHGSSRLFRSSRPRSPRIS